MFYHRGVLEESISTREFQNYISFKRKRWDVPNLLTGAYDHGLEDHEQ